MPKLNKAGAWSYFWEATKPIHHLGAQQPFDSDNRQGEADKFVKLVEEFTATNPTIGLIGVVGSMVRIAYYIGKSDGGRS